MVKVFGFGGFGENFKYQENFSDTNEGSYSYLFKCLQKPIVSQP